MATANQALQCSACGKSYSSTRFLNDHERKGCATSKRALSKILETSKLLWEAKKRRRLEDPPRERQLLEHESGNGSTSGEGAPGPSEAMVTATGDDIAQLHPNLGVGDVDGNEIDDRPIASRRTRRIIKKPARFLDEAPVPYAPLPNPRRTARSGTLSTQERSQRPPDGAQGLDRVVHDRGEPRVCAALPSVLLTLHPAVIPNNLEQSQSVASRYSFRWIATDRNSFGFVRVYYATDSLSGHDADAVLASADANYKLPSSMPRLGPFANLSSFELGEWYWMTGGNLTMTNFDLLLAILTKKDFSIGDIASTNWRQTFKDLAANKEQISPEAGAWIEDDGWRTADITLDIPFHSRTKRPGTEKYVAGKLHYRSIVGVIHETLSNHVRSRQFHFRPYKLVWKRDHSAPEVGVQGELFTSPAFLQAHEELQHSAPEAGCNLERVVLGLMFWSDGTLLTSFGGVKLWPCYMYFGNESKNRRTKGSENLCEHIAYFEELRGDFKDYVKNRCGGKAPPDKFIAFCNRLMFQAQWDILLDEDLKHAMQHGIVITCYDGIQRRFYPRIFTYSADYPEKVLIATVRDGGACACPRCTVPLCDFGKTGMEDDRRARDVQKRNPEAQEKLVRKAHELIYGKRRAVANEHVENILKPESWTPVINVFSKNLGTDKINIFSTLVVDLLHDFEIGVWKSLFMHLNRLLQSTSTRRTGSLVAELNYRYRHMPTFGRDVIRKFSSSVAEGKRKAARDYEDLLQCAIPAFEDLLPSPHNQIVLKLLYMCAEWHALAKLRLHTDLTLRKLDNATTLMSDQFRTFANETCSKIVTYELKSEQDSRNRRKKRASAVNGHAGKKGKGVDHDDSSPQGRQQKHFNINTYKFHALGDFVDTIRMFGTTDSFSTEVGEKDHCDPKDWFKRTNKKNFSIQIARIERRRARLRSIREKLDHYQREASRSLAEEAKETQSVPMDVHHTVGSNQNCPLDLQGTFGYQKEHSDPALLRFIPKLKIHLVGVLRKKISEAPRTASLDWTSLTLEHARLYNHKIMQIRYTTYDVRRAEDVIHVDSDQSNVMVINPDFDPHMTGAHPFRYAKVIGIYHANPYFPGLRPTRVDVLWVRWYEVVDHGRRFELDRLQFCPATSPDSFGFLDPSEVIRAVHIVPQFSSGLASGAPPSEVMKGQLWRYYYVNRFADRDLFMRFLWGHAIGHTYTWKDQEEGSAYHAKLEDLISSVYPKMPPSVTQTGNTHTELTNPASSSPGSNTASDGFVELDSHRGTGPPTHSSGQGHSSDGGRADVSEGMQSNDVGEAEGNDDEDDGDDEDEDEDEGEDEDEDDDAEVGSSEGESGESEDEWDRLSDDEIVANDDMYHDW